MTAITLSELEFICRAAGKDIDRVIAPVVKATANKIAETQRANIPVRSGKTRDSIEVSGPGGARLTPTSVEAEIGPTWWIGRLIENGTVRTAPHVFIANSYEPHAAAHRQAVLDAVINQSLKGLAS